MYILIKAITVAALFSAAFACRATEHGAASKPAPSQIAATPGTANAQGTTGGGMFLTQTDFQQPTQSQDLSATDLTYTINNDADFYNVVPTYYPPMDPCILQMQKDLKATVAASQITFDLPAADLTNCENTQPGFHVSDYQEVTVRMFVQLQCPGVDLSKFSGASFDAFSSDQTIFCAQGGSFAYAMQSTFKSASVGTQSEKSAYLGADNGPCRVTSQTSSQGSLLLSDGCVSLDLSANSNAGASTIHYTKVVHRHAAGGQNEPYYRSGSLDFVLDNWAGTMAYTGAQAAPTWTAQNAAGASASGAFAFLPYGEEPPLPLEPSPAPPVPACAAPIPTCSAAPTAAINLRRQRQPQPALRLRGVH